MAGNSNSGRPRTSDEDKKRNGTFRLDRSAESYAEKDASKIVSGIFHSEIPIPSLPLDDYGRATYEKWARLLLEQGKLTSVTAAHCESLGLIDMRINQKVTAGKAPTADDMKQRTSVIRMLGVAENAPVIAGKAKSRFEGAGFCNSRTSPYRLRPHSKSGSGKL